SDGSRASTPGSSGRSPPPSGNRTSTHALRARLVGSRPTRSQASSIDPLSRANPSGVFANRSYQLFHTSTWGRAAARTRGPLEPREECPRLPGAPLWAAVAPVEVVVADPDRVEAHLLGCQRHGRVLRPANLPFHLGKLDAESGSRWHGRSLGGRRCASVQPPSVARR